MGESLAFPPPGLVPRPYHPPSPSPSPFFPPPPRVSESRWLSLPRLLPLLLPVLRRRPPRRRKSPTLATALRRAQRSRPTFPASRSTCLSSRSSSESSFYRTRHVGVLRREGGTCGLAGDAGQEGPRFGCLVRAVELAGSRAGLRRLGSQASIGLLSQIECAHQLLELAPWPFLAACCPRSVSSSRGVPG